MRSRLESFPIFHEDKTSSETFDVDKDDKDKEYELGVALICQQI